MNMPYTTRKAKRLTLMLAEIEGACGEECIRGYDNGDCGIGIGDLCGGKIARDNFFLPGSLRAAYGIFKHMKIPPSRA
jgi:hypothetical protein